MPPSAADLDGCAERHLARYCDVRTSFAWPWYDIDPSPGQFSPTDLLASAFLDAPVRGQYARAMLQGDEESPLRALGDAVAEAVTDSNAQEAEFEDQSLDDDEASSWRLAVDAFEACQDTAGIKTTTVSKILHRKLPRLVPVNDPRVRRFYDVRKANPWDLWEPLQRDLGANGDLLDQWRNPYVLPDGRQMSRLRCLDIVVWMHESENCPG